MFANTNCREDYRRRLDGVAYTTYVLVMLLVPLKIFCRKKAGGWKRATFGLMMLVVLYAFWCWYNSEAQRYIRKRDAERFGNPFP